MVKLSVKSSPKVKNISKKQMVVAEPSVDIPVELSNSSAVASHSAGNEDVVEVSGNNRVKCVGKRLVAAIDQIGPNQRQAVIDIGFGGLLHLRFTKFPRDILPLLLDAFDSNSFMFKVSESTKFLLSKDDVCDIFQLPSGPAQLPLLGTARSSQSSQADAIDLKMKWCRKFEVSKTAVGIPFGLVSNRMTQLSEVDDAGDEFKQLFVLLSMGTFLAPTSNNKIDFKLVKAVEDVGLIRSFDWCSYVFEKLVLGCSKSKNDKCCVTGCLPILYIAYFHRFNFRGVEMPSALPLIQHWDYEKLATRAKAEVTTGSLGMAPMSKVKYPISRRSSGCPGKYFPPIYIT